MQRREFFRFVQGGAAVVTRQTEPSQTVQAHVAPPAQDLTQTRELALAGLKKVYDQFDDGLHDYSGKMNSYFCNPSRVVFNQECTVEGRLSNWHDEFSKLKAAWERALQEFTNTYGAVTWNEFIPYNHALRDLPASGVPNFFARILGSHEENLVLAKELDALGEKVKPLIERCEGAGMSSQQARSLVSDVLKKHAHTPQFGVLPDDAQRLKEVIRLREVISVEHLDEHIRQVAQEEAKRKLWQIEHAQREIQLNKDIVGDAFSITAQGQIFCDLSFERSGAEEKAEIMHEWCHPHLNFSWSVTQRDREESTVTAQTSDTFIRFPTKPVFGIALSEQEFSALQNAMRKRPKSIGSLHLFDALTSNFSAHFCLPQKTTVARRDYKAETKGYEEAFIFTAEPASSLQSTSKKTP